MNPISRTKRIVRTGVFLLVAFPLVVVAYQGIPFGGLPLAPIPRAAIIAVILACFTHALLRRERRSIADYQVSFSWRALRHLLAGFAGGFALFCVGSAGLRAALPFEWGYSPAVSLAAILMAAGHHLATNACEELAWHGFAFDSLIRLIGFWPSQLIMALVSACFHVVCGWSWAPALISTTAGSVLFGLVFFHWRSLPAALGVHCAWNWTRDVVFGPATAASILIARGTENWTVVQWNIAQAILVSVTWIAALVLTVRLSKSPAPDARTAQ